MRNVYSELVIKGGKRESFRGGQSQKREREREKKKRRHKKKTTTIYGGGAKGDGTTGACWAGGVAGKHHPTPSSALPLPPPFAVQFSLLLFPKGFPRLADRAP